MLCYRHPTARCERDASDSRIPAQGGGHTDRLHQGRERPQQQGPRLPSPGQDVEAAGLGSAGPRSEPTAVGQGLCRHPQVPSANRSVNTAQSLSIYIYIYTEFYTLSHLTQYYCIHFSYKVSNFSC